MSGTMLNAIVAMETEVGECEAKAAEMTAKVSGRECDGEDGQTNRLTDCQGDMNGMRRRDGHTDRPPR